MPTVSEPLWPAQDEKTNLIVKAFLEGVDSEAVFRARLYGNGLRGQDLALIQHEAFHAKFEQTRYVAPTSTKVLLMERDGNRTTLRFTSSFYAGKAVELLRRQPNVLFACRVEN